MSFLSRIRVDDDEQVAKAVCSTADDWVDWWEDSHQEWRWLQRQFLAYQPESLVDPNRSNIFIPLAKALVESEHPRHMEALFATDPPFNITPSHLTPENEAKGEVLERLINVYMDLGRFKRTVAQVTLEALVLGLCPMKFYWDIETDSQGRLLRDMPIFRYVSPFRVFRDPRMNQLDISPTIHREFMRKSRLIEMAKICGTFDKDAVAEAGHAQPDVLSLDPAYIAIDKPPPHGSDEAALMEGAEDDPWVEVLECSNMEWIFLVDRTNKKVIARRENNLRMDLYRWCEYNRYGDMATGYSLVKQVASLNIASNTAMRTYLDNMVASVHNMWIANKGSGITKEDLIPAPNKLIQVENPDGRDLTQVLRPLSKPAAFPNIGDITEMFKNMTDQVTGQSPLFQGSVMPRQETKYGIMKMVEESTKRHSLHNTLWGDELIGGAANLFYRALRVYQYSAMHVTVPGRKVPRELLEQNFFVDGRDAQGAPQLLVSPQNFFEGLLEDSFRFFATGSAGLASREYQLQMLANLRAAMLSSPFIGPQPVQGAPRSVVEFHRLLDLQMIDRGEYTGKEELRRAMNAAYDEILNAPPPAPQPGMQPGAPPGGPPQPQPGGAPPPQPSPEAPADEAPMPAEGGMLQ